MNISENDKIIQEIWSLFKETDAKFKETDKKIKSLAELFTGQWGKLVESSGIREQVRSRGIMVTNLSRWLQSQKNGHHLELDFLMSNEHELVLGEVKTTLRVDDIENFIVKLNEFLKFYPIYTNFKIYGALIGIRIEQEADKFAYRQGLFVFKVGGENMLKMMNAIDY